MRHPCIAHVTYLGDASGPDPSRLREPPGENEVAPAPALGCGHAAPAAGGEPSRYLRFKRHGDHVRNGSRADNPLSCLPSWSYAAPVTSYSRRANDIHAGDGRVDIIPFLVDPALMSLFPGRHGRNLTTQRLTLGRIASAAVAMPRFAPISLLVRGIAGTAGTPPPL